MAPDVPVLTFDELDSTNAEARRRAESADAGPLWITAERQTAGRGRRGRPWETARGNLAATFLMVTDKPPAEAAQVSFVAALAVADLAAAHLPPEMVQVKWPNDVLVDGRKVSGILVESGRTADGRLWLAVGIGVNLAHKPEQADRPATALAEHMSAPPSPAAAFAYLSSAFARWLETWLSGGFAPIAEAWAVRAYGLGAPCIAHLPHEVVAGIAEGLDADGALRLRLADGIVRRITAGDVFFEGAG